MKIRFYLDTAAVATADEVGESARTGSMNAKAIVDEVAEMKQSSTYSPHYPFTSFKGLEFYTDEHGIYTKTNSFFPGIPRGIVEAELPIKLVTLYDEAPTGKPALGIYEVKGARAIVDSFSRSSGKFGGSLTSWRINISGEEFDDVVQLYRSFREGKLMPTECWTDLSLLALENQKLQEQLEAKAVAPE